MKKLLCFALSIFMALSIAVIPAYAENIDGLESAILTVKSRVEIPQEYSEFESDTLMSDRGVTSYDLKWSTLKDENDETKYINITIDQYGNITKYSTSERNNYYYNGDAKLPNYTEEQLIQIGYDFLQKLNPDLISQFSFESGKTSGISISYPETTVIFHRYINGLPVCGDTASLYTNTSTGEISSMRVSLTYCDEVPMPDNLISESDAIGHFNNLSPMTAKYISSGENKAILVYEPKNQYLEIDAKNGGEYKEYTDSSNKVMSGGGGGGSNMAAESASDSGLTEKELEGIKQMNNLMSTEQLRSIAEGMTELNLESDNYASCSYRRVYKSYEESEFDYYADLTYIKYDENNKQSRKRISFNAATGEFLNYYSDSSNYGDKVPKYTEAQALDIAKSFADKYSNKEYINTDSDLEASDKIDESLDYYNNYYFTFERKVNGFNYSPEYISVKVDKLTNEIISFTKQWSDKTEFESTENMISAEEAAEALMNTVGIELCYVSNLSAGKTCTADLVYKLKGSGNYYISAKTGKRVNYNGDEYKETQNPNTADDISGHYAEKQITALLAYNAIILPEGETSFRPDEAITQGEMITFASILKGQRFPRPLNYETIYRFAKNNNIVDYKDIADAETICTRENGTMFIIRALGYQNIAELPDIFDCKFADKDLISPGMEGYVALSRGFGLIGGNPDNTFNPQGELTRADAAIMIYNFMTK